MEKPKQGMPRKMLLYFIILAVCSIALGFSDNVFSNYYKDAYNADAVMRGFIEFPRELPGVLCVIIIAALSMMGDVRLALIAEGLCLIGITALGLFTPSFSVMLIFLFISSLGMHLFMPLSESIGLSIIDDPKAVGKRMGQYNGVKTAFVMLASIAVFFGFRSGVFSFKTPVKWVFLLAGAFFLATVILLALLMKETNPINRGQRKLHFVFRKEYTLYYILAVTFGARKQIMYVYAPWVLIELMGQGADTMALLGIAGSFIGIFFMPRVGKWIDRFGVRAVLFAEAAAFIVLYVAYAQISGGMSTGALPTTGVMAAVVFGVYLLDRMTIQLGMVRTVYLDKIALSREDITPTLTAAMSLDHIVSIICAYLGGLAWSAWGPQFVFYIAAVLTVVNLIVAWFVKVKERAAQNGDAPPLEGETTIEA